MNLQAAMPLVAGTPIDFIALLVGLALLANHFERSHLPAVTRPAAATAM